jgi:hypothetical protein
MVRKEKDEEVDLRVIQRDSKEGYAGKESLTILRWDLKMKAVPPPCPEGRGL